MLWERGERMALGRIFNRAPAPGPTLAQLESPASQAPLVEPLARLDGQPYAELARAAKEDAVAAAAQRAQPGETDGPRRAASRLAATRDPERTPPGPRRAAFSPQPARRSAGFGPVSDARSLIAPWSAVCQIETAFSHEAGGAPSARLLGMGVRLGPNLVLTAAQMLLRPDLGEARSAGLYFHNGADQPLQPISFRTAPGWRRRVELIAAGRAMGAPAASRPPLLGQDDYAVIIAKPRPGTAFAYTPIHAVRQRWFADRKAARYRLVGAPSDLSEPFEPHRLYEASDFAWAGLPPRLKKALDASPSPHGARRFLRHCVRHRVAAPAGFTGAPLLAQVPDPLADSAYDATVAIHLGGAGGFGVARLIDDEMKRQLSIWAREARRLIESGSPE